MKKVLVFLALSISLSAAAQSGNERLAEIRKMYADIKQRIADIEEMDRTGEWLFPRNCMEITSTRMVPAIGEVTRVDKVWFDLQYNDDDWYYNYPVFITRRYNASIREYYEEYLFDPDNHCLVFCYAREQWPGETPSEVRYYWDSTGENVIHTIASGDDFFLSPENIRAQAATMASMVKSYLQ